MTNFSATHRSRGVAVPAYGGAHALAYHPLTDDDANAVAYDTLAYEYTNILAYHALAYEYANTRAYEPR